MNIVHICFIYELISIGYSETGVDDLAQKATETGDVTITTSSATDPIGIEGLWGLNGTFIVDAGCQQSYKALTNIPEYPTHTDKVKRVEILERTEDSLKVDYTEGGFGFESTSTQLWHFKPTPVPSITSESVGEDDTPSWVSMTFHDTGNPNYCEIHIQVFADVSFVPKFVMNWMSSMAADELATTYRVIIQGSVNKTE